MIQPRGRFGRLVRPARLPGRIKTWRAAVLALAVLAGLAGPARYASGATAGTVHTGSLAMSPKNVNAGDTADSLAFTWTNSNKAGPGTVSIVVPAGFSVPQAASAGAAGYLQVTSGCARFQVTGVSPGPGGASVVSVAENCASGQEGVLLYSAVTVPTTVGSYLFDGSFSPAGASAPTPFANPKAVTVKPGPLASLTVSPATATINSGGTQAYAVDGFDAYGNARGAIASPKLTIKPDGSCAAATCTAATPGAHTVTAKHAGLSATATLTVAGSADLAVTESVSSASPYYYALVSFTTTVTNTSTSTAANGVTVTAVAPAGLVSPGETVTAGSYAAGTWAVGSLAAGASATLTISGYAGAVSLGTQTVTATVTAATADPNGSNNSASASEASQPAELRATITPLPDNPQVVDIGLPGDVGWTASAGNADSPAAPALVNPGGLPATGDWLASWTCSTESGNPCPFVDALANSNPLTLAFPINQLGIENYLITLTVCAAANPNYTGCTATTTSFTTTNSGG